MSYLRFIVAPVIRALARHPQCNARYDATRQMLLQYRAVHVGIAVQTPQGLKVPVVRDQRRHSSRCKRAGCRDPSLEQRRSATVARGPRNSQAPAITVTSLREARRHRLDAPSSIRRSWPSSSINRAVERPMVRAGVIAIRRMMNLSSSFDHRFIDGFDAARLIQTVRESLEQPALLFI